MAWPNRAYHYVAQAGTGNAYVGIEQDTTLGAFSTRTMAAVILNGYMNHTLTRRDFHTLRTSGYLELPNNRYLEILACRCKGAH